MKSVSKNSRHIWIKYFFVTDRVKDKEFNIVYCQIKEMVTDFFTKPLQGVVFITQRKAVLGISQDGMPLYVKQYEEYVKQRKITDTM